MKVFAKFSLWPVKSYFLFLPLLISLPLCTNNHLVSKSTQIGNAEIESVSWSQSSQGLSESKNTTSQCNILFKKYLDISIYARTKNISRHLIHEHVNLFILSQGPFSTSGNFSLTFFDGHTWSLQRCYEKSILRIKLKKKNSQLKTLLELLFAIIEIFKFLNWCLKFWYTLNRFGQFMQMKNVNLLVYCW